MDKERNNLQKLCKRIEECSNEQKLKEMLEKRGRQCISSQYIKKGKDAVKDAKDMNEFVERLRKTLPLLKREGEKFYMIYPRCYCHHLRKFKGNIPPDYCYCSVGWIKELFEQSLGRAITVNLESSILRGDNKCRLRIIL